MQLDCFKLLYKYNRQHQDNYNPKLSDQQLIYKYSELLMKN
jgi:hypothetical protein